MLKNFLKYIDKKFFNYFLSKFKNFLEKKIKRKKSRMKNLLQKFLFSQR